MSDDGDRKRGWTPRRVFRWVGVVALAIALFMAVLGAYGLDTRSSLRLFFVYWTVFFALLLGAIALAVFDALVTMVKFRKEHMELRKATRHSPHGDKRNDP